ncbi:hypothetical protein D3C84_772660 [compost metagenome]
METGAVQLDQQLPCLDQVAFMHHQLSKNPTLQALDFLDPAVGHDTSIATGHYVKFGPSRPDDKPHNTEQTEPED